VTYSREHGNEFSVSKNGDNFMTIRGL